MTLQRKSLQLKWLLLSNREKLLNLALKKVCLFPEDKRRLSKLRLLKLIKKLEISMQKLDLLNRIFRHREQKKLLLLLIRLPLKTRFLPKRENLEQQRLIQKLCAKLLTVPSKKWHNMLILSIKHLLQQLLKQLLQGPEPEALTVTVSREESSTSFKNRLFNEEGNILEAGWSSRGPGLSSEQGLFIIKDKSINTQ